MKSFKESKKLVLLIVIIPLLLVGQYFMFSKGVISPLVKGVEIKIIGGNYIKELDKYVIKLGDDVEISAGNYVKIPGYAQDPKLWFNALDDNGIIEIKDNKITALKEGYTSVAVMKGTRVIKKAMLKVVNPDVESLDIDVSDELKYVGDKANITSSVAISDYQKFKDTYKTKYLSSNESVLKIDGDEVEAVGVGTATISGECGGKTVEIPLKIEAKVAKLEVAKEFILEEGQNANINPKITTTPKGLKAPDVEYKYTTKKKKDERAAYVSSKGQISAVREGTEKIIVSCGEKKESIKITVKKRSIKNSSIKNINYSYNIEEGKMKLEISWDSLENIKSYDIYVKGSEDNYDVLKSIPQSEEREGKISTNLEFDLDEDGNKYLDIYIVGNGEEESTKPSEKIVIEYNKED